MFLVGIAAVAAAGSAQAQTLRPVAPPVYDRGNNQGVRERPQPEYEPLGIPVGAFRFYPRIGAAVEWNDNIYATEAFEVEDMATILSAAGRLTSNWSQHALAFEAEVENTAYGDNDAEDGLTWGVGVEGRVDVRRDTQLYGSLSYFSTFEPRGFVDTLDLAEPIEYDELRGQARLTHLFNRLRATGIVDYSSVDYDDGMDVFDVPVDQDFRDRDALELTGRLDYALSPDTAVFVAASQRWSDYDLETFGDRDFERTRVLGGAAFDITNLVRGEVGVGYSWARFNNPADDDFDGLSLRAAVDWFITRLTTVNFAASRDVEDSGDPDATSIQRTSVGVRVDHELYRNIVAWGRLGWSEDEYEGIDRTNTRNSYSLGADWRVNRYAAVNARYIHTEQETEGTDPFRDFTQNRFLVGVTLRR
ncbi:MAG: outer membrane beta-barrel protein [Hyphomonadaceae bacterium]